MASPAPINLLLANPNTSQAVTDRIAAVARAAVALLSDWFPATTGEIVHVDGGVHAVG
mgnify:CR=1 FL=1